MRVMNVAGEVVAWKADDKYGSLLHMPESVREAITRWTL